MPPGNLRAGGRGYRPGGCAKPLIKTVRLPELPAAASRIAYIAEVSRGDALRYIGMHSDNHFTFDEEGKPQGKRMIRSDDRRHFGKTTLVFYDGHAEPRRLTPKDLPVWLFNPHAQ